MSAPTQTFRPLVTLDVEDVEAILRAGGIKADRARELAPVAATDKFARAAVHAWIFAAVDAANDRVKS